MNNRVKSEKGSALLITLCLMGVLTLVGIWAVNTSTTDIELSYNHTNSERAFYIADAGAKRAFVEINNDNSWRTGYADVAFGQGTYSVALIDSTADSALVDTVILRATAVSLEAEGAVEIWTAPVYLHPFTHGLFGDKSISLDRNTCTDSFNSDSGSYAATVLNEEGSIGSNGTVSTAKDVAIGGDVSVATPGGLSIGPANSIAGDTTSAADSVTLNAIPDSEYTWAKANSSAPGGLSGAGYTYNNGLASLTLGSFSSVTLTSGVYFFSDLTLGQDSEIKLAPGANVTIYVTGDIHFAQNSTINAGGAPSDMIVYSKGPSLQFDQGNEFVGAFYGPLAHIQYDQTTQVYGSLVGGSIKLDKGACFHYDRNLAKFQKGTTGEMIEVAWREL